MSGTLYVVATPLGNLEDITLRAVRVLKGVALIAAEDTRHSRKLLSHYDIRTPLVSYYDHVERKKAPRLVERLTRGQDIALISDAGTPGIADPGFRLVGAAIAAGVRVVPVPGPSVVTAALSAAGLATDRFAFEGFVPPRQGARRSFYARLRDEDRTIVCFEAGRRLVASLRDLADVLGEREIVVAREVTKLFEDYVRGSVQEVRARIGEEPVRGEVTLCMAPSGVPGVVESGEEIRCAVARLREEGLGLKEIARTLSKRSGWSSRAVYRIGLELVAEEASEKPSRMDK